jgi:hypothetical protein
VVMGTKGLLLIAGRNFKTFERLPPPPTPSSPNPFMTMRSRRCSKYLGGIKCYQFASTDDIKTPPIGKVS